MRDRLKEVRNWHIYFATNRGALNNESIPSPDGVMWLAAAELKYSMRHGWNQINHCGDSVLDVVRGNL